MKLSDAPTTRAEIEIEASAETVWRIVTDLQTPALSSPEFKGAEWLDGAGEPAVGARFTGRNAHPAIGSWETTCVVSIAEEPREFAYVVGDLETPSAVWRYLIEPIDRGGVLLRQIAQIGPGPSGLTPAIERMPEKEDRIVERRLQEHQGAITANLAQIKRLAEGGE
ncbi:SRPBCC family protein [Nocardioides insulae]|uniref:SRPBCC family protein n=1 Tax=Nocardioides insulae TaxID=394734 RepID=UPI0003F6DDDA|nr:SRPBCC family protein [Nocardioides insulae]